MRQFREGLITAAFGLGTLLACLLLNSINHNQDRAVLGFIGIGVGMMIFLVGVGIVINARWFTVLPKVASATLGTVKKQILTDRISTGSIQQEPPAQTPSNIASVTEGTTRELR